MASNRKGKGKRGGADGQRGRDRAAFDHQMKRRLPNPPLGDDEARECVTA